MFVESVAPPKRGGAIERGQSLMFKASLAALLLAGVSATPITAIAVSGIVAMVATTSVEAKQGDLPFYRNPGSPQKLAAKIRANLALDPTGRTVIDKERCDSVERSCASPENYVDMLGKRDARAGQKIQSVDQLADYFDSLVLEDAPPPGEYYTACMRQTENGDYIAVWNCLKRAFKKSAKKKEKAWVDPKTGEVVFFEDCSNPIGRISYTEPCVILNAGMEEGQELRGFRAVVASPTDPCGPSVKVPGSAVFESLNLHECDTVTCSDAAPIAYLQERQRGKGDNREIRSIPKQAFSIVAKTNGRVLIRLSPGELTSGGVFILCLRDPKTGQQSYSEFVFGGDGRLGQNSYRERQAYVSHPNNMIAPQSFGADGGVERVWTDYQTGKPF